MISEIQSLRGAYLAGTKTPREEILQRLALARGSDPKIWITLLEESDLEPYLSRLESRSPADLPLYGIPFAIKDNIDLAGIATTAACPDYRYFPKNSATVVRALTEAGAVPLGKTNLDQFATGLVGVRSPYGFPQNAYCPDYIPGGSSAGSAIAVAKKLVSFSLGTDTAGSGRIPASLNNLVGLKPTRGLCSTSGVVPACRTLDCISIFAHTAADAAEVFETAAVYDASDAYARPANTDVSDFLPDAFTFGVPPRSQLEFFGNSEAAILFDTVRKRLTSLGGVEIVIDFAPFLEAARLLYDGPWVSERYLATEDLIGSNPGSLHPVTRQIIMGGKSPAATEAFAATYMLQSCKRRADEALEGIDFVLTPTNGTIYTAAEVEADPVRLNSNLGYYTNFMNLLDFSAIAVPAGFFANGHPFGVTLFAPAFHDRLLLAAAARHLEEGTPPLPPQTIELAVCGAHMKGLPLHHELESLGAKFVRAATTSPDYKFFAIPDSVPKKPGLVRVSEGGGSINIEIYALSSSAFGRFVAAIPAPLGIGKIETAGGARVCGFLCEPSALAGAEEITALGSWRNYPHVS